MPDVSKKTCKETPDLSLKCPNLSPELLKKIKDFVGKNLKEWDDEFDDFYEKSLGDGDYRTLHKGCRFFDGYYKDILNMLPDSPKIPGSKMIEIMEQMHQKYPDISEEEIRLTAKLLFAKKASPAVTMEQPRQEFIETEQQHPDWEVVKIPQIKGAPVACAVEGILIKKGQQVEKGEKVMLIKFRYIIETIVAPCSGIIQEICIKEGTAYPYNTPCLYIKPLGSK